MSQEARLGYLANPRRYCDRVTHLIEKGDDNWRRVWEDAIIELFQNKDYNVNSINSLLKVIEKAFKERTYTVRAQAFECWQFFITKVEKYLASEKLLNVILIPLCASNHSIFIVFLAKLNTWFTLLNTNLIVKAIIKEKGIPNLLKILYGPHSLQTAASYSELLELCGNIYFTLVQKCLPHEENNIILSYVEKAVPVLSYSGATQVTAKKIWMGVLDHVSQNKWQSIQFNHLMKTLENLMSDSSEQDNAFLCELLSCLICEYNSIPVDCLMPHLNLITRCLFHSSVNDVSLMSTMESLLRMCKKKENFFFEEVNKTLSQFSEDYKNKLQKYWIAVVTCFCKWIKTISDFENCDWIFLFPVKHLHEKWNAEIVEQMQQCYENISLSGGNEVFIRNLFRRLDLILNKSENVPTSLLNAATCLCKVVLQKSKPSEDLSSIRPILLTIYQKMPAQVTVDGIHKSFVPKYLTCVLYFVECYPDYSNDFSAIIRRYSQFIDVDKDGKELPVVQLMSKYTSKLKEDSENNPSVLRICNGVNVVNSDKMTPGKTKVRSSFLARLSPADKKSSNVESSSPARSVLTPKSSQKPKIHDNNDIQFIPIPAKPKNSPMTEHQKEMAKEKSYIPALYEDLSQSQSQSDSMSLLSPKKKQPISSVSLEHIEENANLPSSNGNAGSADEVPASFNFRDLIRPDIKKSLFAEPPASSALSTFAKKTSRSEDMRQDDHAASLSESPADERASTKRKSLRIVAKTPTDPQPPKRSRLSAAHLANAEKTATPSTPTGETTRRSKGRLPSKSVAKNDATPVASETDTVNLTSESQNLFITTPGREIKTPTASPMVVKARNSADGKNSRRRSLRTRSTDQARQSPVATRRRKSLTEAAANEKESAKEKAAAVVVEVAMSSDKRGQDSSEEGSKKEAEMEPVEDESSRRLSHADSASSSSSSAVTVILGEDAGKADKTPIGGFEVLTASQMLDSIIIIDDEPAIDVITISDSQTLSQPIVDSHSQSSPAVPEKSCAESGLADTKVDLVPNDVEDESTFFESTQPTSSNGDKSSTLELVETTPKNCKPQQSVDVSAMSQTRSEHSFNLAMSPSESVINDTHDGQLKSVANSPTTDPRIDDEVTGIVTDDVAQHVPPVAGKKDNLATDEVLEKASKSEDEDTRMEVSAGDEKVEGEDQAEGNEGGQINPADESCTSLSPISSNTRTSQMLKMVFSAQSVPKPKGRVKSGGRSPASGAGGGTAASGTPRTTTTNSRTMKMLQVNGHRESPVRPSPSKKTNIVTEKIERLNYTPKECTSPGILKKSNLNCTLSPKSPKSVNFAENLTDTREYQVDEDNYSDSWASSDNQLSNNLLSEEEGTSQETLYSPLHNCSDDIKNIVDRLSLNQQQLDTLRRMGIETVGQLAAASTIVGKSIPVGDNRLARLRAALKAYDNDRKLKGLRAPSVRRKIVYKSQTKQLEVGSIIEILDDIDSSEPETPPTKSEKTSSPCQMRMPTLKIIKVEDDESCSFVLKSNGVVSPSKSSKPIVDDGEPSAADAEPHVPTVESLVTESKTEPLLELTDSQLTAAEKQIQLSPVRVQLSQVTLPYSPPSKRQPSPAKRQASPAKTLPLSPKRQLFAETELTMQAAVQPSPTKRPSVAEGKSQPTKRHLAEDDGPATSPAKKQRSPDKERPSPEVASEAPATQPSVDVEELRMEAQPSVESGVSATPDASQSEHTKVVDNDNVIKIDADEECESRSDVNIGVECAATPDNVEPAEAATENDVTDDVDFICTGDDEAACKAQNLRTYSRLVKARKSVAPLLLERTAATDEVIVVDDGSASSPEIITVESKESRNDEEKQRRPELAEPRDENSARADDDNNQHSMSIFSPDVTREGGGGVDAVLDSTSQSLIDGSRLSDMSRSDADMMTLSRWESRIELRVDEDGSQRPSRFQRLIQCALLPIMGATNAACFTPSEDKAEKMFTEMVEAMHATFGAVQSNEMARLKSALDELNEWRVARLRNSAEGGSKV